ncbi:sigma-70 family RNA polymerase sigma factor [Pseudomonas sp. 5P_3.1_Bac2]|uniref:sigma-70 family RNA polymerase sigma factor n=1 Tax=Pseudomonas sp. 5P_3.1_Bac2 TaxID=2971617 RepID=UPI0021CA5862|nr:sigma-70 family RNA polymerase sigma factor [Pseudomonas sp. 5P_3.1_Bac2]MCU1717152.1 sigma-70 family RNA polymerase sigma factor [Pseudomonas sp. 5P_3.1_Bac2]
MDSGSFAFQQQLQKLYVEHHSWLCRLLRRKLGNAVDAADLAQDVYLLLLRRGQLPTAELCRCHLSQIAKGLVIDLYRRRRVETCYLQGLGEVPEAQAPSEEARALVGEALVEIDTLLHNKPANTRDALLLSRLDGLGHRAIAEQLQVSVSSVEKYIAAALKACQQVTSGAMA